MFGYDPVLASPIRCDDDGQSAVKKLPDVTRVVVTEETLLHDVRTRPIGLISPLFLAGGGVIRMSMKLGRVGRFRGNVFRSRVSVLIKRFYSPRFDLL